MNQATVSLPQWLKNLQDAICDELPEHEAVQFDGDFLASIPFGADIKQVLPIITIARLERCKLSSEKWGKAYREQVLAAIDGVIALYRDPAAYSAYSARLTRLAANTAANAAEHSATDSATYFAARLARLAAHAAAHAATAAHTAAPDSARLAAAYSAYSAYSAPYSAAYAAARLEAWRIERDVLLDALRQCKGSL